MPISQAVGTYEKHWDILVGSDAVIATYTLDATTVSPVVLPGGRSRDVLPEGTVLIMDPTTFKVEEHGTEASVLGILLQQADATDGDIEVAVVWRGDVRLERIWDNAVLGTLTVTASDAFADRIVAHVSNRL